MTTEHSPLPWRTNSQGDLFDSKGKLIYLDGTDKEIANARLIVRAVNSHARLLAAAKDVIAKCPVPRGARRQEFDDLQAAIAAAEELVS